MSGPSQQKSMREVMREHVQALMALIVVGVSCYYADHFIKSAPAPCVQSETSTVTAATVRQRLPNKYVCCERWSIETDTGDLRAFDFCAPPQIWIGEHGKFVLRHHDNDVLSSMPECEELTLVQRDYREIFGKSLNVPPGATLEGSLDGTHWTDITQVRITANELNQKTLPQSTATTGKK